MLFPISLLGLFTIVDAFHGPIIPFLNSPLEDAADPHSDNGWDCEVRAWVRAPDLRPSASFPAQARLAANGSDCGDIERWEVGLRFKERAIIKLKSVILTTFMQPLYHDVS